VLPLAAAAGPNMVQLIIREIRRVLNDSNKSLLHIVLRRGYRLVLP
jgi:DNA-binding winged helix-turn-helix (wHTH) protein